MMISLNFVLEQQIDLSKLSQIATLVEVIPAEVQDSVTAANLFRKAYLPFSLSGLRTPRGKVSPLAYPLTNHQRINSIRTIQTP